MKVKSKIDILIDQLDTDFSGCYINAPYIPVIITDFILKMNGKGLINFLKKRMIWKK